VGRRAVVGNVSNDEEKDDSGIGVNKAESRVWAAASDALSIQVACLLRQPHDWLT
jgi:hypothetical protein